MNISEVDSVLLNAGFTKTESSNFGDQYSRPLREGFAVTAYASRAGSFFDTTKSDEVKKVDFTLESRGTTHRCLSIGGLQKNLSKIVAELDSVSKNPDLLKCPECKTRYVHMKEPLSNNPKKFKPFLSCEGMYIVGKGAKKHAACTGVSKALPALVNYG